jgi:effector-binding domain-containing protein
MKDKIKTLKENSAVKIDINNISENTFNKIYNEFNNHYQNGDNKGYVQITKFTYTKKIDSPFTDEYYSMTIKDRCDLTDYEGFI